MSSPDAPDGPADVEGLLEESWPERGRRLGAREVRLELTLTAAVLALTGALVALAPGGAAVEPAAAAVVVAYAIASRVEFPIGVGFAVPTQLFLVALFGLAAAPLVPALVLAGLALGSLGSWAAGRSRLERVIFCGGDAIHALGPALVFVAAGHVAAVEAPWPLLGLAFAAQLLLDFVSSGLREWIVFRVRPEVQVRVLARVWAVDAILTPVGVLAALHGPWTPLVLMPLVALLAFMAHDRSERIGQAHRRLQALQRERRRLQIAVRRIGDAFASSLDLDALLDIVTRAAVEALDASGGRASAFHGEGRRLVRRATVHETPSLAHALTDAETRALEGATAVEVEAGGVRALACPLGRGAGCVGVVTVARRAPGFAAEERELLAYLCEQAAVSAANVLRHQALHRDALTDELTGLANHRRLQEVLGAAVDRHAQAGAPVGLVLLDLDGFKVVNDTHGHQTGDLVLRAIGRCLREHCRVSDEAARYGGEELAVVVADADQQSAQELAERLRDAIEGLELTTPTGEAMSVTASFGVAVLGGAVRTKAQLIAAADSALYEAKAAGKNRVRTARPYAGGVGLRPVA